MNGSSILDTVARQASVLAEVSHRPWPLPETPWVQAQTRRDVLLAHWPVALDELARLLPPELEVDTFGGEAWVGISACRVTAMRLRGLPPLPGLSSFPQLEVFACVTRDDRPGHWLFSLDVTKQVLAEAAKRVHRLPAYRARISTRSGADGVRFDAERDGLAFRAHARAAMEDRPAPGTLEFFLLERFALYTADGGRLYRAELHHRPWDVRRADVTIEVATIAPFAFDSPPLGLYSETQDLLVWPLQELA